MVDQELTAFLRTTQGVKDLVDKGLVAVPKFYQRPAEGSTTSSSAAAAAAAAAPVSEEVPVIDLSKLHGPEHSQVIQQVAEACEEWGFFQVINHGVAASVMQDMIQVVHEFFSIPAEQRMELYSMDLWKTTRFGTSHNPLHETVLEWKDYLRHPCLPLEKSMLSWPKNPPSYRRVTASYCKAIKVLADTLLELLSESLGLDPKYLGNAFGQDKLQEMFSNYYPPCPNPELTLGIAPHSDAGGVTILLQNNVTGLEVLHNGLWSSIEPVQGALVINLGDQIQILSNGRFKSVEHRASVNRQSARISVPTFYQPAFEAEMSPIPQLLQGKPALYKTVKFQDYVRGFFRTRLNGKSYIESYEVQNPGV